MTDIRKAEKRLLAAKGLAKRMKQPSLLEYARIRFKAALRRAS